MDTKKKATTFVEQINKLLDRGVIINDKEKAKEVLSDIGYYRLGFYFFPFEKTYPKLDNTRKHTVLENTKFEDAVALYYYDFDLRNILNKYLARIEVAIRTTMVYELSNKYHEDPTWFISPKIVNQNFIDEFSEKVYKNIKKKEVIKRHKRKHPKDVYAPAWKTMEFMVFGNLTKLYDSLLLVDDMRLISLHFGVKKTKVFINYIEIIRLLRNACAHGNVLYDLKLETSTKKGPAGNFTIEQSSGLASALGVVRFLLKTISTNRLYDMDKKLKEVTLELYGRCPSLRSLIENRTGFKI